jgi:hypothetical protein
MVLRVGSGQYYNAQQINNFQIPNLQPPLSGSNVLQNDRVNPQATINNAFANGGGPAAPAALLMLGNVQPNGRSNCLDNNIWRWTAERYLDSGRGSIYTALQAHSEKRFSHGLNIAADCGGSSRCLRNSGFVNRGGFSSVGRPSTSSTLHNSTPPIYSGRRRLLGASLQP